MSVKSDGGLRQIFRRELAQYGFETIAIETGNTSAGVPDSYWMCGDLGADGWVEHKKTDGWVVECRPHQVGLHMRMARAGIRSAVAVLATGVGSGGPARSALWLVRGAAADRLSSDGLQGLGDRDLMGRWEGRPASWDWRRIGELLIRG